uniref:Tudor-knot domain-containing protein n=1 Tax=Seriola dumerili TaxID=41447 RepID=A0A3B4VM39_SERDU
MNFTKRNLEILLQKTGHVKKIYIYIINIKLTGVFFFFSLLLQMKTPPERSGITFKVGAQLEARDRQKNWYTATIEKIDYNKERVLIHYRQWSRRHDEWFQWNSPYLRPMERVNLRRQGRKNGDHHMLIDVSEVLKCIMGEANALKLICACDFVCLVSFSNR